MTEAPTPVGDVPSWMEAVRTSAGELLAPAVSFARWKGPWPFPSGREGIRRLARLVEDFAHDVDAPEDDDARFVEGAGALLGLLLLDHVGRGAHVARGSLHRLALGRHGFFDPFAAIDAALDAERPAAELARGVERAEAEAAGDGPFAKAHAALERALERLPVRAAVLRRFEATVELEGGVELDLGRFLSLAEAGEVASLDEAMDRLVGMIAGADVDPGAIERRVLPRIVSANFVDRLDGGAGRNLASRALGAELLLAFVLQFEDRARFVTSRECAAFPGGLEAVEAAAFRNLAHKLDATRVGTVQPAEHRYLALTRPDGLAASLLASPEFRRRLLTQMGGAVRVGLPHRDVLLIAPAKADPAPFAAHVADTFARAPHGISALVYELHDADSFPLASEIPTP